MKTKSGLFVTVSLIVVFSFVLGACSQATATPTQSSSATAIPASTQPSSASTTQLPIFGPYDAKNVQVAILYTGLVSGDPWNALGNQGMQAVAKDLGVKTSYTDNLNDPDMEAALRDYASQGYQLVIGDSGGFNDPAVKAAKDFPNTLFAVVGGTDTGSNLMSIKLKEQENSYLAGVLAGLVSKTGKIGLIGAFAYPSIVMPFNAFYEGAKSVNPNIQVTSAFLGSWSDPTKGQELATSMIQAGVDVMFVKAGATADGVAKVTEATPGTWFIPEVSTCMEYAPNSCLTSEDENFDKVFPLVVNEFLAGKLTGGMDKMGIKEGAVDLGPINSAVSQDIVDKVMKVRQSIIDGTFVAPEIYDPEYK